MFSALATLVLMGAPVTVPEVTNNDDVKAQMGNKVVVVGQFERVTISKGKHEWKGTALVLDDDTVVYLSYEEPKQQLWETLIGMRLRVEGTLRPNLNEHEQSLIAPHLRDPGVPRVKGINLLQSYGQRVRLSGVAQNAKGGALVVVNEANTWYLENVPSWPDDVVGKLVGVGGTLARKQYLPEGGMNEKGEYVQGAQGTQNVIEAPTWRVIGEPRTAEKKK